MKHLNIRDRLFLCIGLLLAGLFLLGPSKTSLAQDSSPTAKLDSLDRLLAAHPTKDSIRFNLLMEKFKLGFYHKPDSSLLEDMIDAVSVAAELAERDLTLAHQRLAIVYDYILYDHFKALDHFLLSIEAAGRVPDTGIARTWKINATTQSYLNISNTYTKLADYDRSLEYQKKAIDILEKASLPIMHTVYANIAVNYTRKNEYAKALENARLGLTKVAEADVVSKATYYNTLAAIMQHMDSIPQALTYINESLSLVEQHDIGVLKASAYGTAAGIYVKSGDYVAAERYAKTSLDLFAQYGTQFENRVQIWQTLAELYRRTGRYKDGMDALETYVILNDSLQDETKKVEFSRMEMQYEYDRKESLAKAEVNQHKTARNYTIAGGVVLLLAAGGIFSAYNMRRQAVQRGRELEYKASLSDTEMKVLRLQMNPHFIFNSLNSISDYIGKNDIDSADYYLAKFAKLMRGILENSEEQEIPLSDELKMLELYMQLEASRLRGKFTYQIQVAEGVDTDNVLVPPLILQPFVENSIWHGIANKAGTGIITIAISKTSGRIHCAVVDDGIGRLAAGAQRQPHGDQKSYGMNITRDRIEMLNKRKGMDANVQVLDLQTGTRVEINLPWEERK